jgi:hypothetical protein
VSSVPYAVMLYAGCMLYATTIINNTESTSTINELIVLIVLASIS